MAKRVVRPSHWRYATVDFETFHLRGVHRSSTAEILTAAIAPAHVVRHACAPDRPPGERWGLSRVHHRRSAGSHRAHFAIDESATFVRRRKGHSVAAQRINRREPSGP